MAWKTAGKRVKQISRPSGRRVRNSRKAALSPSEKRHLLQLAVCCGIFVLLVSVKLLLPEQLPKIRQSVSTVMDRNMDVGQVFSAVGGLVTGREPVEKSLEEVYQAVFAPEQPENETETTAEPDAVETETELPDAPTAPLETAASVGEAAERPAETEGTEEPMALSYVLYSGENLPENATMEQAVLGFDYVTPVTGALSSPFGYREHPIEGEDRFHYGLDIAADTGTAITCFASGEVSAVGESSSYGKYLIVNHNAEYSTLYAHCSSICVHSGEAVKQGQTIAEVGDTGMTTGPHLHFELHRGNTYLNPIYYVSLA